MAFLFLHAWLAISALAAGAPICPTLLDNALEPTRPSRRPVVRIEVVDSRLRPREIQEVHDAVTDAARLAGSRLELPEVIKIKLHRQLHDPEFIPKVDELKVPYQLRLERSRAGLAFPRALIKHPKHSRVAVVHELGHQLFNLNLAKRDPKLAEKLQAAQRRYLGDLTAEYQRLAGEPSPTPAQRKRMGELLDKVVEGLNIKLGYEELWADLLAVSYARDPSAVRDALFFAGSDKPQREAARRRDFDGRFDHETWTETEPHVLFSPVRAFIGARYLTQPKYARDPALLLERVLDVIRNELDSRAGDPSLFALSPSEANRRLIDRLKREIP